jgi:hypothetical protein
MDPAEVQAAIEGGPGMTVDQSAEYGLSHVLTVAALPAPRP